MTVTNVTIPDQTLYDQDQPETGLTLGAAALPSLLTLALEVSEIVLTQWTAGLPSLDDFEVGMTVRAAVSPPLALETSEVFPSPESSVAVALPSPLSLLGPERSGTGVAS